VLLKTSASPFEECEFVFDTFYFSGRLRFYRRLGETEDLRAESLPDLGENVLRNLSDDVRFPGSPEGLDIGLRGAGVSGRRYFSESSPVQR
jgi:hypothetical protein